LKPMLPTAVCRENKSSALRILMAWRSKTNVRQYTHSKPLSTTWTNAFPASFIINLISVASASTAFSSNSLTTEAGLWTTSPAAIWLATWSGVIELYSTLK
jgi:hypothetical protein